ncbi:MAG: NAD(P)-dependent oxidoreductase, partial [Candidatus Levybacteria bacterium]|nr:NAD(P)-dependent oxidoreductase [Candidatus Levybacteria bacterium]
IKTENALSELASENFTPVLLRNATVYGYSPKLRLDLVVNNLVAHAIINGKIKLYSDGKAYRPIIHVDDLARFFLHLVKAKKDLIHNRIFNVGSDDQNFSIIDIAKKIQKQLPKLEIIFAKNANADKRNYKVNFGNLKKTFSNFKFKMDIDKGIRELIEIIFKNKITFKNFEESGKFVRIKRLKDLIKSRKVNDGLYWNRP